MQEIDGFVDYRGQCFLSCRMFSPGQRKVDEDMHDNYLHKLGKVEYNTSDRIATKNNRLLNHLDDKISYKFTPH